MTLLGSRNDKKPSENLKKFGLLTAVPGLLLAGPLVGFGIGWYADSKLGTDPYLVMVGTLVGLASAGIEIAKVLKRASAMDKDEESEGQSGD
ncbi:MAG: AtpZ/AtpI family protein [bacterium]